MTCVNFIVNTGGRELQNSLSRTFAFHTVVGDNTKLLNLGVNGHRCNCKHSIATQCISKYTCSLNLEEAFSAKPPAPRSDAGLDSSGNFPLVLEASESQTSPVPHDFRWPSKMIEWMPHGGGERLATDGDCFQNPFFKVVMVCVVCSTPSH